MKPIAIQLYTVREEAARDFPGVLKKIADIGYKGVELAGLHGLSPKEVRSMLDDLGLEVTSAHMAMPTPENVHQLVDECNALGVPTLVSGFGPDQLSTLEGCLEAAATLRNAAQALEGTGISFAFHNHYWEFHPVDGKYPEDILLDEAPGVYAQLDVYWAQVGGVCPAEYLAKRKDRIPLLHIKDGMIEPKMPMTPVGAGKVDFPSVIKAADPNVLQWLIVEMDEVEGDMMEAVAQSYRYLTENGLGVGNK